MSRFDLRSEFQPTRDQQEAVQSLLQGLERGLQHQVLLGVTGSGKTFSIANVMQAFGRPALVISHNKTLAAQLYQEYKEFFPKNAVEYFVSYYDYYQPEAYLPPTDTYIEKDVDINEDLDKLRLSATTSLLTRQDVIVVASVSCIYNLGSPLEYHQSRLELKKGMPLRQESLIKRLVQLFYERSDLDFRRGTFRVRGEVVDVRPAYLDDGIRLKISNNFLIELNKIDPLTGAVSALPESSQAYFSLFPAKHYITPDQHRARAIKEIQQNLQKRLVELKKKGKNLEAYRLEQRTNYDLELIEEIGYCKGIENYSRYFDGRVSGEPPYTLLDFFTPDHLTIIDESHITVPQLRGMYSGDRSRKQTLIEYGFRLPSAMDNRPLRFEEFLARCGRVIYTSATPAEWELSQALGEAKKASRLRSPSTGVVEQLIRPTGLVDPEIEVRGTSDQIEDVVQEVIRRQKQGERTLITTLTKRLAEDLAEYLGEQGLKVHYLHADIDTLERTDILADLRRGKYDVLVGINLLREGLDLPEVSLVIILDADKEGFLRSDTSLIQTMGRAARHVHGKVILYADQVTGSMQRAMDEVNRRRRVQEEYNREHHIKPVSIKKPIRSQLITREDGTKKDKFTKRAGARKELEQILDFTPPSQLSKPERREKIQRLRVAMNNAAAQLEFEKAALLRDEIAKLKKQ